MNGRPLVLIPLIKIQPLLSLIAGDLKILI